MPRKRKVPTAVDSEMMPPPPVPAAAGKSKKGSKKNEAAASAENENPIRPQPRDACPVTAIFEKAQTNESLHVKYFKELNNIYEKVIWSRHSMLTCQYVYKTK